MSLHMSSTEKLIKGEGAPRNYDMSTGDALERKLCLLARWWRQEIKKLLPSVSLFWSEAGKNSQTLLDRTVKAPESVCSPWRKKHKMTVKLNVNILAVALPGCSAVTGGIHIFIFSSGPLFPLHQRKGHGAPTGRSFSAASALLVLCGMWNFSFLF